MRSFINIITEALSINELFNEARSALSSVLNPRQTYQLATRHIVDALSKITNKVAVPEHPIRVLVDVYPNDPKMGRLTAHEEGAFMILNFEGALTGDWGQITDEDMKIVIFRLSQAFAHEMQHYQQYLRNWSYFQKTGSDTPATTFKSDAAAAARELINHYGSGAEAISAMKMNISDALSASETMTTAVRNKKPEQVKRFLSALYTKLQD